MMVLPIVSAPLALVVNPTVQFADMAPWRSEGAKLTEATEKAGDRAGPLSPASCVATDGVVLGLAVAANAVARQQWE